MARYIAYPDYAAATINIYDLSVSPPAPGATFSIPAGYCPNDVLIYQDPQSPGITVFVSVLIDTVDGPSKGMVYVYIFDSPDDIANGPWTVPNTIAIEYGAVGMAVQPGTGDLYIAATTFSIDGETMSAWGGIICYTRSSAYIDNSTFTTNQPGLAKGASVVCSNLAFDPPGNLWMTTNTADNDPNPANHYVVCYPGVGKQGVAGWTSSDTPYLKIVNGAAGLATQDLQNPGQFSGKSYPFANPRGIAFDPLGNLWLANNNASGINGTGTLMAIPGGTLHYCLLNLTDPNPSDPYAPAPDGNGGYVYTMSGEDSGPTPYALDGAQFGGLLFDGFTLYATDAAKGVVWTMNLYNQVSTPSELLVPSNVQPSGVPATSSGNGGVAIFNTTPAALLIRDTTIDAGKQPGFAAGSGKAWESPDIGVSNLGEWGPMVTNIHAYTDKLPLASWSVITGPDPGSPGNWGWVTVRVANFNPGGASGGNPTTGTEVLKVYWAWNPDPIPHHNISTLNWPYPWDGMPDRLRGGPIVGGLVNAVPLGKIDVGNETVFQLGWNYLPEPAQYGTPEHPGHFYLLARIEAGSLYPFGMTYPEQTDGPYGTSVETAVVNAANNSTIAGRKITIGPTGSPIR